MKREFDKVVSVGVFAPNSVNDRSIDYALEMRGLSDNTKLEVFDAMLSVLTRKHPTVMCTVVEDVSKRFEILYGKHTIPDSDSNSVDSGVSGYDFEKFKSDIYNLLYNGDTTSAVEAYVSRYKVDMAIAIQAINDMKNRLGIDR